MRLSIMFTLILLANGCSKTQPKSGEFLKRGEEFMKAKDYPRAILQFKNEGRLVPTSAEPHYQMALAYLELDNRGDAVAHLREATLLDPKHVQAQLKLAEILSTSRNKATRADAEKRAKDALALAPDMPEALSTLALTELSLGKTDDAIDQLGASLKKFPNHLKSAELLAMIKSSKKDLRGAEAALQSAVRAAPNSADAAVAMGRFYSLAGKNQEAESELRRALALDPNQPAALAELALVQLRGGRTFDAETTFKKLSDMPDQYKYLYGRFLVDEGKKDGALAEFERLIRKDPKDRKARTLLTAAYVEFDRLPDAEKTVSNALRENPKNVEALLQRGEIRLKNGRLGEAQNDLNQVLKFQPDSAEAHYIFSRLRRAQKSPSSQRQELDDALRLKPNLLRARLELAQQQLAERKAAAALQTLDNAPEDQKSNVRLIELRNWALLALRNRADLKTGIARGLALSRSRDLLLQNATVQMSEGSHAAARASVEEVLKQHPEDVGALEQLMLTYVRQKQFPEGIRRLKQIVGERPQSIEMQLFLGGWLQNGGMSGEARAIFEAIQKAHPEVDPAEFALARLDYWDGNYEGAKKRFSKLKASRDYGLPALVWLGQIEEKRGNVPAAIDLYRAAVEKDGSNTAALNNLAYLLADVANRPDEALQYAQQAKELAPKSWEIDDTIGWAYYKKAIYSTAVGHFEKAVAQSRSPRPKYHLAMAYLKTGDRERGRKTLDVALKQDSSLPEAGIAKELAALDGARNVK